MLVSYLTSPTVTIVVIGRNVSHFLSDSIPPILNQSDKSHLKCSIVFVNDGSTDDTLDVLDSILLKSNFQDSNAIKVLSNTTSVGPARARNLGANQSTPDFYIFLDSDDIIDVGYLDTIVNFIKTSNVGIAWGRNIEFGTKVGSAQPVHSHDIQLIRHREFLPAGPSNNMILSAKAFHDSGGFPCINESPGGEDTALCFKVQLLGYRSGHCSDAVVLYRQQDSLLRAFRQQFNYGFGSVAVTKMFIDDGIPIQPFLPGLLKLFMSIVSLPIAILPKYRLQIIGRLGRRIGTAVGAFKLRVFTL
jgi:glycosyltransferase involved in cell wall biosynthesis